MPKDGNPEPTKAGIQTNADGTRFIPASVRPDGTLRKEIKIKPGYRPPEDIEKYKNRTAEAFRNKGKGGVPGADAVEDSKAISVAANKNAKRRDARKKAAAEKDDKDEGKSSGMKKEEEAKEVDPEAEKQKEAKKLAKRIRQAKELKDKKELGAPLLPEQFEKVIRINELIRQLDALGFDIEGEKKEAGEGSAEKT